MQERQTFAKEKSWHSYGKYGFIKNNIIKAFEIPGPGQRGHTKTKWTRFWPFLTTYLPQRGLFYPKSGQKEAFFDHLPTSSCPRSFWTTPKAK